MQVEQGGLLESDDWLVRHTPIVPEGGPEDYKPKAVSLDKVRSAGYDSVYSPRSIRVLDKAIVERLEAKKDKQKNHHLTVQDQKRQAELALMSVGAFPQKGDPPKSEVGKKQGKHVVKSKGWRAGGRFMGCRCDECKLAMDESRDHVKLWHKMLPEKKIQCELCGKAHSHHCEAEGQNPMSVDHFDQYIVYDPSQAIPRYLITFEVKEPPKPPAPEAPPCWLCSEPPLRIVRSQCRIVLHLTGQEVDVCYNCAGLTRLPDAPRFLATVDDQVAVSDGIALAWTEPFAPAPIDMYLLQHTPMKEGADELPPAHQYVDIYSDPVKRTFLAKGLPPGPHCFRVRAKSAAGWGPWSEVLVRRVRKAAKVPKGGKHEDNVLVDIDGWIGKYRSTVPAAMASIPQTTEIPSPDSKFEMRKGKEDNNHFGTSDFPFATFETDVRVQHCCAWNPVMSELWLKEEAASPIIHVHNREGKKIREEKLPCFAVCMTFGHDGALYVGTGGSAFVKLNPDLSVAWTVHHMDGPCARGVAIEDYTLYAKHNKAPTSTGYNLFAAYNTGPILQLDPKDGKKLRVIQVNPGFHMALSMALIAPGLLAVSDSGRILLYKTTDGKMVREVTRGYLNAAITWDGKRLMVANANSNVWHCFKPDPRY
mmetsp:Transcript_3915/g.6138  ORF Transcript_3915/g.6138 Transcript_3915/m.6138 type:complete len:647 (+) Transcript_3915:56-1996(+)